MARTIEQIQADIYAGMATKPELAELNSTSKSAIYRLMIYIVSFAIWTLEKLFDVHVAQINQALYEQKSGTERWYRNMALAFQYGFDIVPDTDKFDNGSATDEQIEASKIVKYCSVKESQESNRLTMKIAAEISGELSPLTEPQKESFLAYMQEIKYAGVKVNVVNNPADRLDINMVVYRDPLVIDANGNSILNGGRPVEVRVKQFMKELPFNGELVLNDLIETIRAVPGVVNVNIVHANSAYYDVVSEGYSGFSAINVKTVPVAGYFEIVNFDNVTYVV